MTWHYAEGDDRKGPVDEATLGELVDSGHVGRDTLVWRAGMEGWLEAEKVAELRGLFERRDAPLVEASPYAPPRARVEPIAAATGAAAIPRREAALVIVLSLVTCGIYGLYLLYKWAEEINLLAGTQRFNPLVVLIVSIVTCGIGGAVFHILMAFEVEKQARQADLSTRLNSLGGIVVALLVGGILLGLVGVPAGLFTMPVAYWLVQAELNKLAA